MAQKKFSFSLQPTSGRVFLASCIYFCHQHFWAQTFQPEKSSIVNTSGRLCTPCSKHPKCPPIWEEKWHDKKSMILLGVLLLPWGVNKSFQDSLGSSLSSACSKKLLLNWVVSNLLAPLDFCHYKTIPQGWNAGLKHCTCRALSDQMACVSVLSFWASKRYSMNWGFLTFVSILWIIHIFLKGL